MLQALHSFCSSDDRSRALALGLVVAASAIAAQVHAWAAPEHLTLQPLLGVGFLIVSFVQGAYAAALLGQSGSAWLIWVGLAANLGFILVGFAAHMPGQPLAVLLAHEHSPGSDVLEQIAFGAEAAVVAGLVHLLPIPTAGARRHRRP